MTTETQQSIIEHIRSLKEENAAEYGFSLEALLRPLASVKRHLVAESSDKTGENKIR